MMRFEAIWEPKRVQEDLRDLEAKQEWDQWTYIWFLTKSENIQILQKQTRVAECQKKYKVN